MDPGSGCVLITGSARRLGRALAEALAKQGTPLALHYHRSRKEAEALAAEVKSEAHLFGADLAAPGAAEQLARDVWARCGPIAGLVNNASIYAPTPLSGLDRATWHETLEVNLTAPVWLSIHLGRRMREAGGGSIVQVGDWSADRPYTGYLPYTVSKGALETATRALARELAPRVRVNMIRLGPILLPEGSGADYEARVRRKAPLRRVGGTDAYVSAVTHLLGPATYCTGSILTVDGGRGWV